MPTMNIKDPEVHRMAHELAKRRHTTATGAVREALAKALAEDDAAIARNKSDVAERILEIGRRSAAKGGRPPLTDDEMYDDDGLPR